MGSTAHCGRAQSEHTQHRYSRLPLPRQVEVGAQFVAVNSFAEYETILTGAAQHCNGCAAAESEEAKGPHAVPCLPVSAGGRKPCGPSATASTGVSVHVFVCLSHQSLLFAHGANCIAQGQQRASCASSGIASWGSVSPVAW